jgi:hypothetical protein
MCCKRLFLPAFTLFILTFTSGCVFLPSRAQGRGAVLEKWQTENKTFKVRVTSYEEKRANVNGAYYVFEAGAVGTNTWREILTFRHDDHPKIPADQVRFVNDQIGYLFMGWVYAVTVDGGNTWSEWDARRDLTHWQCCNYQLIRDVKIAQDGTGIMRLNPIQNRSGEVPELRTIDYGKHWQVE